MLVEKIAAGRLDDRPQQRIMPRRRGDLIVNRLAGETLIYDPRSRTAHRLPRIVALVFDAADGETPFAAVEALLAPHATGDDTARALLRTTLDRLAKLGLLEPEDGPGPTRRAFLSRGGQIAAALPVITSIVAPSPAAAVSIVGGVAPVLSSRGEGSGSEAYDHFADNPFRDVRLHPVSTFAADVDTAAYSNVRRFLRSGQLPPADAVRVEEMINYFRYEDPEPTDDAPLALHAELSDCPWQPEHRLLRLGLQAPRVAMEDLPPCNLVFLLDVSGSMQSPDKLPLLRRAMSLLVATLRPQDNVAIAVYAGAAGLVLEPTRAAQQAEILAALDALEAGGSTDGGAGIELAYRTAAEMARGGDVNRVILATDGDFNVGLASRGELVRLIERQRQHGVYLSVLGFGTGNLKDSAMEQLANHGNGNYAYIDSLAEARRVLVREAGATLHTIAADVKLQIEWNPHEVQAYRLIGYENRLLSRDDFADDAKDAGEVGSGHHLSVLYQLVEPGTPSPAPAAAPLRYQTAPAPAASATSGELGLLRLRYKPPAPLGEAQGSAQDPDAATRTRHSRLLSWPLDRHAIEVPAAASSDDYRLAAGVAAFGMLLRGSPHLGAASWVLADELIRSTLGGDREGFRQELLELVGEAADLARGTLFS